MSDAGRAGLAAVGSAKVGLVALATALVAGLLVAVQAPSYADVTAVAGSAYGYYTNVSLFGGPAESRGPDPVVTLASDASNSPQDASVASAEATYGPATFFRSGQIDVHAEATLGGAGSVMTSSDVDGDPDPEQRPGPFVYDNVVSSCTATESALTIAVTVTNGVVYTKYDPDTGEPTESEAVPANPEAGYTVEGTMDHIGDSFRIVFNEQATDAGTGAVTVNAAHLYLLGPTAVGDVIIAQSMCGITGTAPPTDPPTEDPTDPPTEDPPTEDPPTEDPTDPPTEDPTDPPTEDPTEGPTEGPTDEPGGLEHGGRLDGGGQADPIGQAIETSGMLFDDGEADRVLLATADRFPDALAGAGLAGDDAPILFTSGLGDLDPRTAAEITRVTGGQGVVLVLGGTAAVSEAAATQARAAAGDQPCSGVLPPSCRFAGTGREHTAALIAAVVLAEHPGTAALLARGDEFADAITGGAYAARVGVPILLTPSNQLNSHTRQALVDHDVDQVTVLGGTVAIEEAVYAELAVANKRRVAGPERTATAAAIATELWDAEGLAGGGVALVNVRHSNGWQTALAAAVVSARSQAPQLGVESPPADLTDATVAVLAELGGPVMAFGDVALVSDEQLAQAVAAAG